MAVLQTTEVPVGNAGTPSYTFTGDLNTGIYSPAADQVGIATAGALRLLITDTLLRYNGNDVAVKNGDGTLTIADGTAATHAVTKQQLDSIAAGYDPKQSCKWATVGTETFTISGGAVTQINGTTIDGGSPAIGDRILIKNAPVSTGVGSSPETTQPGNGIYRVTDNTTNLTVTRDTDADISAEVTAGMYVFVTDGTANADSGWVLTTSDTITLNTTALNFVQFTGAGQITAGAGLLKTGNTLDVQVDNTTIEINTDILRVKDLGISTAKIANDAVTYAKMQNISAQYRILGRISAAAGDTEELTPNNLITVINQATTDIADARLSSNVALLNAVQAWTAAQYVTTVALTDAANIATNAALGNVFRVVLAGNRTLDNPTNLGNGQTLIWHVKQDATGSRTLAFGTKFEFKGSSVLSTTANAVDIICGTYNSTDDKIYCTLARADVSFIDAATLDGIDSTGFLRVGGENQATAAITFTDTTKFLINFAGLATTGIKWDTTENQIQFQDAGTTRAYIDLDNGEFSATSIVETSDERLKKDITNIDPAKALKQVRKLQGVYFSRIDTDERELGFIAQRVKALEPRLTSENKEGILSVAYPRITALLVEAIKQQQDLIDTMRQEIDALKNGDKSSVRG